MEIDLRCCIAALCLSIALAGAPSSASASAIDGISDQLLPRWYAGADAPALLASQSPGLVSPASLGRSAAAPISYARFVVPWDAIAEPGGEALHYELFRSWLEVVKALGLIPDVAIEQAEAPVATDAGVLPRVPSSPAQYERYVRALLELSASVGEPISYLEAWNEPNAIGRGPAGVGHPSASMAAAFMDSAAKLCEAQGCQAIAGDFADGEYGFAGHPEASEGASGMGVRYEREYIADLGRPLPLEWGIHPYAAVKYETRETIAAFAGALPSGASVWFTEVGVYECQRGKTSGTGPGRGEQEGGARYLQGLLDTYDIAHAFYYEPKSPSRLQEAGCPDGEDTSLYSYENRPRPTASIVFGGEPVAMPPPLGPLR